MTAVKALRTPDDRFTGLSDFPYPPNYVEDLPGYEGLRAHYVDLGPRDAEHTFLCLHGEPTWGYLYRSMIPIMVESGARVIVPDFFGFGRSDKPVDESTYSFDFHRRFLLRFIEHVDPRNLTLVVQDWGGSLGLTLPVDLGFRSRLARLLVMNTVVPVGVPLGRHFYEWRALVQATPDPPVGQWIRASAPRLTNQEAAAYDAPFPDSRFKGGVRSFPALAMVKPEMEGVAEARAALRFWAEEWSGQTFMAIGARDPDVESMHELRSHIRGCPEPMVLSDVGHFVQEELGQVVARAALRAFGDL